MRNHLSLNDWTRLELKTSQISDQLPKVALGDDITQIRVDPVLTRRINNCITPFVLTWAEWLFENGWQECERDGIFFDTRWRIPGRCFLYILNSFTVQLGFLKKKTVEQCVGLARKKCQLLYVMRRERYQLLCPLVLGANFARLICTKQMERDVSVPQCNEYFCCGMNRDGNEVKWGRLLFF